MRQFLFFVFQAVYTILANVIDDGFANKVSIDSVIAYGSYIPMIWVFQSVYNIGKYAYINTQKEEKTCMLLGFLSSIFMLLLGLPIYRSVHILYHLTDPQIDIFNKLMLCYLFTIPFRQIGDYLNTYLMCQFENKTVFVADIMYWVIAIALDMFVYVNGYPVHYLVVTTGIAYFVYDAFLLYCSRILKKKIDMEFMKEAFSKGKDIVIDRLMGKVATLSYGAMAARLDTRLYAIHCVVYGIICNSEEFTNNFGVYCLARLKFMNRKLMTGAKILIKKYGLLLFCIEYSFAYVFLLFYHGAVPLSDCLVWLAVYMTDCISLLFYEVYKSILSCYGRTEYLRYGGVIGIFIRIPVAFVMWKCGFGLIGFGLACTIDFGLRGLYYYCMAKRYDKVEPVCS